MRKFTNIYPYMRRPLVIYDFDPIHYELPDIYEENVIFFLISVDKEYKKKLQACLGRKLAKARSPCFPERRKTKREFRTYGRAMIG
jgi:hypothetical protein